MPSTTQSAPNCGQVRLALVHCNGFLPRRTSHVRARPLGVAPKNDQRLAKGKQAETVEARELKASPMQSMQLQPTTRESLTMHECQVGPRLHRRATLSQKAFCDESVVSSLKEKKTTVQREQSASKSRPRKSLSGHDPCVLVSVRSDCLQWPFNAVTGLPPAGQPT